MAGEIALKAASGLAMRALVLGENRTTRWNGAAMVAVSAVSSAAWATGLITITEQLTSNAIGTGIYVGNFPAALTTPGEYIIEFFPSAAPAPGDIAIGVQSITWDGGAQSALLSTTVKASVADTVFSRGVHHIKGSAEEYSLCSMAFAMLNSEFIDDKWNIYDELNVLYLEKDTVAELGALPVIKVS